MSLKRKRLNIILIVISIILGVWAACLYKRPALVLEHDINNAESQSTQIDKSDTISVIEDMAVSSIYPEKEDERSEPDKPADRISVKVASTRIQDVEPQNMIANHPFRQEAIKVLNGHLEENDSVSRQKILSYCEHLRTSYITGDIDFIRQVFSDYALIIVGNVVKAGDAADAVMGKNSKVKYNIRSKQQYLEKLSRIFDSGKKMDVKFSGFRIMRHPTIKGIYGVTMRQEYKCGNYSDDGYLFLLWDFRNMSMPQIHVRTWQPSLAINVGDEELIDISDFNLE